MNILLAIGTHGDEKIGRVVADALQRCTILRGSLTVLIANEKAYERNVRFIDQDLNRSFPGTKKGNHEQRLAHSLLPIIESYDMVIDIHSTTSELRDAIIVTSLNKKTRHYINVISPKYALWMRATGNSALISNAKIGIAFEYGKDKDPAVAKRVIQGIMRLLMHERMIAPKNIRAAQHPIKFFKVTSSVPKPVGAVLAPTIKNYKLITKGTAYAKAPSGAILARRDFYPILFGQHNYTEIFGFAAHSIT